MTQEIEGLITNMIDETQDQGQEKNLKKIQTLHKTKVFSFYVYLESTGYRSTRQNESSEPKKSLINESIQDIISIFNVDNKLPNAMESTFSGNCVNHSGDNN